MRIYNMRFLLKVQPFLIFHKSMCTGNCHRCPSKLDQMKTDNAGFEPELKLHLKSFHFSSKDTLQPLSSSFRQKEWVNYVTDIPPQRLKSSLTVQQEAVKAKPFMRKCEDIKSIFMLKFVICKFSTKSTMIWLPRQNLFMQNFTETNIFKQSNVQLFSKHKIYMSCSIIEFSAIAISLTCNNHRW